MSGLPSAERADIKVRSSTAAEAHMRPVVVNTVDVMLNLSAADRGKLMCVCARINDPFRKY